MQRLKKNDRGAVAVIVSLMVLPIMILAALAIDIGAMHADRQQLQTGADAAVLAAAQDCARDDCSTTADTAQDMAVANFNGNGANGTITHLDQTAGEVRAETSAVREHWFGPIVGIDETELRAQSSARWGYPTGGTAVMPLAYSWCELEAQTGISVLRDSSGAVTGVDIPSTTPDRTIYSTKASKTECTGRSNNVLPGGFGWLEPNPSACGKTESVIDGWVETDPGNSAPSPCVNADFKKWIGKTVLLPIFDFAEGTGNNARYQIFGYAAFTLSGYHFGSISHNAPCSGSDRCVRGSFDRFVDLSENFEYSPSSPRMGASVVALTAD
ncbi:TadE/TadG family type IV pilus assembly protein [Nesterenkonia haasae]|uniref:TadE/TadG family type IV pilus assembly protein n=1 Tax=Nesterenkonia haasae TaxID=2587813 RepID=UPI00139078FD|nr:Tad domain-containing protein [Nesterenkonia haasae]NDK31827.1 hypothetical protein [Nesterenkonia haasae]